MAGFWIGPNDSLQVGDIGFLIERSHARHRTEVMELCDLPAHTNGSNKPRLYGWCGSYNDLSTYARGMGRVERLAKNGRAYVRLLEDEEIPPALEDLGYPELAEQI